MSAFSTNTKIEVELKKQAVREKSIPFHVGDPFYSKANQEYLEKIAAEIESGKAKLAAHELLEPTD